MQLRGNSSLDAVGGRTRQTAKSISYFFFMVILTETVHCHLDEVAPASQNKGRETHPSVLDVTGRFLFLFEMTARIRDGFLGVLGGVSLFILYLLWLFLLGGLCLACRGVQLVLGGNGGIVHLATLI